MVNRDYTWINEDIEHSEGDCVRAAVLAKKWSQLESEEESRRFRRMSDDENYGLYPCEECEACLVGDEGQCEYILNARRLELEKQAERELEIELVEDKLDKLVARMMRPYEHWNEDERYMEYMERD